VKTDPQIELARDIGSFAYDPLKHSLYAFPWGSGALEALTGPRTWQVGVLETIRDHLANPETRYQPCRIAVASGHGVGKSALFGMLTKWAIDCWADARVVITANTEQQLITKTSPEVAKWHRMALTAPWFNIATMKISAAKPLRQDDARLDFVTWSANNTEAFAGLHNVGRIILIGTDESSSIDDKVAEVIQGALTDEGTVLIWLALGNPTRNTGWFRETFGKQRNLWYTLQLDSRNVEGTNKAYLQEIVETYGEESDIAKVRVRGQFPSASSMQFIPSTIAAGARIRMVEPLPTDPLIYGLDCARFGDDSSVLAKRIGRDARSKPWKRWSQVDAMTLAGDVARMAADEKPDAIFVDAGNIGAAVIDRLRQLEVPNVMEVWFGGAGKDVEMPGNLRYRVANKRTEMWVRMRNWLEGGAIPDEQAIEDDLIGTEYGYGRDETTLTLEKKDHMRARGLASPDNGDALACTFAEAVMPKVLPGYLERAARPNSDGEPDIYRELYT
jgi:hypothetical protein